MTSLRYLPVQFVCAVLALLLFSCQKNDKEIVEKLTTLEQVVEQNPDRVLSLLDSVYPYNLNEEDYNKFLLLQIQAKDKAYRDITSDTVVFQVRDYYMQKNDVENTTLASFYCGRVLQEQSENKRAIMEYQTAEKYAEGIKNNTLKGLIQNAIGSILLKEFMEAEAIEHFTKAALYFNRANNTRNEIITYNQMGNAYLMKTVNDSAFYYYEKGFKLAERSNDSLQMANITQCIGIAYRQVGNIDLAIAYFRRAEKYASLNNDYKAKLYLNISKTFYERDIQDSAQFYVRKSLSIAENNNINLVTNIYKTLSQIAEKQRDHGQALDYYKRYTNLLEQIVDENKNTEILELQKKYKNEKLQNENNRLQIKYQQIILISTVVLVLLGGITIFLYKKYIESKKDMLEKENKILDAERKIYQLIEMSNTYNEREDSIKSVLLHHFNILKKAALLKSLKIEDEQNFRLIKKVNEIIYEQESLNWDIFYQHMNKINIGLFERVRIKYPLLDETEFRVCCLTYANLTCSEIGIILDLSANTVQMKRSSIRKKMGIESQGNIQDYIDREV